MKPGTHLDTTASSHADRLATLAEFWRGLSQAEELPIASTELAALRDELNGISLEAEAGQLASLGRALRRIGLLSEVWECLQCEPGQSIAASEVADFCVKAIEQLVRDLRAGSGRGELETAAEILLQSDERWSEYLIPVDSTSTAHAIDDSEPADPAGIVEDDAPSALDQETLLRLLGGATRSPAEASVTSPEPGLKIPAVPQRIDLDDEIRKAFLADSIELFERIEGLVIGLAGQEDSGDGLRELGRCFHTLKGAAGSVGLGDLATLVHELEEQLGQTSGRVSPTLHDRLHQVVNYLEEIIGLLGRPSVPFHETVAPEAHGRTAVAPLLATLPDSATGASRAATLAPATSHFAPDEGPIRVPAARFDELSDLASELIVEGRFWLSQAESIKTFASTVQECRCRLLASLDRLHDAGLWQKRGMSAALFNSETDIPEELSRLEEQADDLAVLAASAQAAASPVADHSDALVRLSLQVWDALESLRVVPIRGLFQRLARVIHDAARVESRQVAVVMKGEETGVDRVVADKAFEPLLHVVRNAVGHGIEMPADRVRAGKPATGCVTLEARREGSTLVIVVRDDGKGLDELAIAEKARRLGWLGANESAGRDRLYAFIFAPGFSTKTEANAISGRGVGMDVVAREVERLRGTIDLTSEPARGTQLTIRLPARLALEPSVILRAAGQPFAIPASEVEYAQPFERPVPSAVALGEAERADPANACTGEFCVAYANEAVPVVFACELLGIGQSFEVEWPKLVIVRAGQRLIGLVVDSIEGAEDLVVKPLGAFLAGHPLVSGTSLSANGEVISVLHSSGFARWLDNRTAGGATAARAGAPTSFRASARNRTAVLVVDDSISVRRGLARQLCGMGLDVHEVSDGLDALSRLRDTQYGLVFTDLEMPKLDGLALLSEIKRSASLSGIPVVVASTRSDPETRRRVLELGAEALLSKPVEPWELARVLEPILAGTRD
jgi:chemotaxis protein histidine kinase CheA